MTQNNLLLIETATKTCAVGAYFNGKVHQKVINAEHFVHSEKLHVLVEELMNDLNTSLNDFSAVVVDKGPGSYTGLRIGVSAAKGWAYALDIPVVTLNAHQIIANGVLKKYDVEAGDTIVPILDARRMEVYMQEFDHLGQSKNEICSKVIETTSFNNDAGKIYLSGDAVSKVKDYLGQKDHLVYDETPELLPENMVDLALKKLKNKDIEDVAYFEPFYLKDFIAGKPKKMF